MGTELNVTSPQSTDTVANYPADEQLERTAVQDLITKEHYEGTAGNDRHKLPVFDDDTARDAAYAADVPAGPQSGNFNFSRGSAVATTDEPRVTGMSFHDGTSWSRGTFLFTGAVIQCAFDPTTIETVSDGRLLPAFGAAYLRADYQDLFDVIGTAFDTQNNVAAPLGTEFRVPNIAGSMVIGLSPDSDIPASYVRGTSGLDDFRATGGLVGPPSNTVFIVQVTAQGTPDTVQWSNDFGATYTTGVSIDVPFSMGLNVTGNFAASTGHDIGDTWVLYADNSLASIGGQLGSSAWQLVENELGSHAHTQQSHTHNSVRVTAEQTTPHLSAGQIVASRGNVSGGGGNDKYALVSAVSTANAGVTDSATPTINDAGGDLAHPTTPKVLVFGSVIVT